MKWKNNIYMLFRHMEVNDKKNQLKQIKMLTSDEGEVGNKGRDHCFPPKIL